MKRNSYIIIVFLLMLLLTACRSKESENTNQTQHIVKKSDVKENKKNNIPYVKLSETYSTDTMKFSIINAEWVNEIKPQTPQEFYSYFKIDDPSTETMIKINGTFKNLDSVALDLGSLAYQIVINDKYIYPLTPTYEENGNLTTLATLKPLEEKNIILFATIPLEAKSSLQKSLLQFGYNTVDDNNMFYSYDSRENKVEFEIGDIKNTLETNSTSSQADSFDIGTTHKTLVDDVNVRAGAGFNYEKLYKLPINTEITILDKETSDGRVWCKIAEDEWISIRTINGEL